MYDQAVIRMMSQDYVDAQRRKNMLTQADKIECYKMIDQIEN